MKRTLGQCLLTLAFLVPATADAGLVTLPIGLVVETNASPASLDVHVFLADSNGDELWAPNLATDNVPGIAIEYTADFVQSPSANTAGTQWCAEVDATSVSSHEAHLEFLQQQANGNQERAWGSGEDLAGDVGLVCMPATLVK